MFSKDFHYFDLSQISFSLSIPEQTISVHVSSDSHWVVAYVPDCVTLNQKEGKDNADLSILVTQKNDFDGQPRMAFLKFVSDNKVYLLTIAQSATTMEAISISQKTLHLDFNQHVFKLQITSLQPWHIISKQDWLQVNPTIGDAAVTTVETAVSANTTYALRQGSNYFGIENTIENGAAPINNVVVELRIVFGSNKSFFIIMNSGIIAKYLNLNLPVF